MANGNALIAALRSNTAPSGAMPGGVRNLSFPWQKTTGGALRMPNRTPAPPPQPTLPPASKPGGKSQRPPNAPVLPGGGPIPPFNPNFNPRLTPDVMRYEPDTPAMPVTSPIVDDMSVNQSLEQMMASQAPAPIVQQGAAQPMYDPSLLATLNVPQAPQRMQVVPPPRQMTQPGISDQQLLAMLEQGQLR